MSERHDTEFRAGMHVYTADGDRVGTVTEVFPPMGRSGPDVAGEDEPLDPGDLGPNEGGTDALGERIELNVSGDAGPLAGSQPTQAELGVVPGRGGAAEGTAKDVAERIGTADVGTDFKRLGKVPEGDLSPEEANADPRDASGYFRLRTGLDASDLYIPLSAVESAAGGRVTLDLDRRALNRSGWEHDPHSEA